MIERVGVHRLDDGYVIDHLGKVRQQFGKFGAAPAVFGEFEFRAQQRRVRIDERRAVTFDQLVRGRFAVPFLERRFVVEQFEMARRPGHEKVDDALGLGREVRLLWRERTQGGGGGPAAFAEKGAEGNGADADAALLEEPAARDQSGVLAAIKMGLAVHMVVK